MKILSQMTYKLFQPPTKKVMNQTEGKVSKKNPVVMTLGRLICRVWRRRSKMTMVCLMVMLRLFNTFYDYL